MENPALKEKYESRILIVDDDPVSRKILESIMTKEGYKVASADDGKKVLTIALKFLPDVILLDVLMPGLDGFAVTKILRADQVLSEVPIILITALQDKTSRFKGIEFGADDFISKPIDRPELIARVKSITKLNRYRRLLLERNKFEKVIEKSDYGYVIINPTDNIQYANPKARLYLDIPTYKSELSEYKFLDIAQKQYHLEPKDDWSNWPQKKIKNRYLVRPETKNSAPFWLEVEILDIPNDLDQSISIVLRDVTSSFLKRFDERLFHQLVLHKLRTPLVSTLGGMELLSASDSIDMSKEEISDLSKMALTNLQRLHGQIEDVLEYITSPKEENSDTGLNHSEILNIIDDICKNLNISNVKFNELEEGKNIEFPLQQRSAELIFYEIIENSKKFHPEQKPNIEIEFKKTDDNRISIKITDDGITLSPEQLEKVWSPYYQGEKHFTGEVSGMGLGLSTVSALIWGLGGECRMYNRNSGVGITVELLIPRSIK